MPTEISLHDLTLPEFQKHLFLPFKRDYSELRRTIKKKGFDICEPVKVRRNKRKKYDVISGVGRFTALLELLAEANSPAEARVTIPCVELNLDNRAAIAVACYDHLHKPAVFTRLSPVQIILIAKLYESLSDEVYGEERTMLAAGIAGTTYSHAVSSTIYALEKLRKMYPDYLRQLREDAAQKNDDYSDKLIDMRLVAHAVERDEWRAFTEFFFGRIKTNKFYKSEYKMSEAGQRNRDKQIKAIEHHTKKAANNRSQNQVKIESSSIAETPPLCGVSAPIDVKPTQKIEAANETSVTGAETKSALIKFSQPASALLELVESKPVSPARIEIATIGGQVPLPHRVAAFRKLVRQKPQILICKSLPIDLDSFIKNNEAVASRLADEQNEESKTLVTALD